jgi:hypothetical protein
MHTPNGLPQRGWTQAGSTQRGSTHRLLHAVAIRPAVPGLVVVACLLVLAASGWTVSSAPWVWPTCAGLIVAAVLINLGGHDAWRRVRSYQHTQRMIVANGLLSTHPAAVRSEDEITGSIRELGGLVERFGQRLDDLLAEVHAENQAAAAKQHRR